MTQPGTYGDDAEFLAEFCPHPADAERAVREAQRLVAQNRGRILADLRRLVGAGTADLARGMGADPRTVSAVEAGTDSLADPVRAFVAALGGHLLVEVVLRHGRRVGFDLSAVDLPARPGEDFATWSGRCRSAASAVVAQTAPAIPTAEAVAAALRGSPAPRRPDGTGGDVLDAVLIVLVDGWRAEIG
ncbi:hypothetical protein [Kitasatospora sp. NPDC048538]|uniref:hypothetical protein n=1 Tax=unclassified Kitasatospora TaxID=2633591 RepID=UPI0033CE2AD1